MLMAAAYNILDTLLFYTQILLFMLSITVASLVGILSYPLLRLIRRKPTTNWVGARALHFLSKYLLAVSVSIEGAENLVWAKETPCILVANHQSLLDTIWLAAMFPRKTVIVANSFIAQLPFLGWFMRLGGNLFVTQGDKNSIKSLFEGSLEYLERENTSIMMFPEGRRNPSETGALLEFKKGAFYLAYCTHAPIIPVAVQCTSPLYSWVHGRFKRHCTIRIRVLAPINTETLTEEEIPKLVASTRSDIQKASTELTSQSI